MTTVSNAKDKLKSLYLSHRSLIPQFLVADTLWLLLLLFIDNHIDVVSLSGLLLPFSVVLNLLLCLVSAIRKQRQTYSIAFALVLALLYSMVLAILGAVTTGSTPGHDNELAITGGYVIAMVSGFIAIVLFLITWFLAARDDHL
jgi:hypothetical protein